MENKFETQIEDESTEKKMEAHDFEVQAKEETEMMKEQEERKSDEKKEELRKKIHGEDYESAEDEKIPEMVEMSMEKATAFKEEYLEQYGRKEYPTEKERLNHLQKFVKKDEIEKMKESWKFDKLSWKTIFSPKKIKESGVVREKLIEEEALEEIPKNFKPALIGKYSFERMHGGGGSYNFYYDQFGNTYFNGPDGEDNDYIDYLAQYFNVQKTADVLMPRSFRPWSYSDVPLKKERLVRFLAESSKTVDDSLITAEDCDKIDPMPVTDPDRSYVSAVAVTLLTGAQDRLVCSDRNEKNQVIRKDGVYYLLDMDRSSYSPNSHFIERQYKELKKYFDQIEDESKKDELLKYLAETVFFFSSISVADDILTDIRDFDKKYPDVPGYSPNDKKEYMEKKFDAGEDVELLNDFIDTQNILKKFPKRFYDNLNKYGISEKDQQRLNNLLEEEAEKVKGQ